MVGRITFARSIFRGAAIFGLVVLLPMYRLAPSDEHLLAYLGFIGLALVFQGVFWIIGGDPMRYRALMPMAVLEKLAFAIPALTLFALGRLDGAVAGFAAIDAILGGLFLLAWRRLRAT